MLQASSCRELTRLCTKRGHHAGLQGVGPRRSSGSTVQDLLFRNNLQRKKKKRVNGTAIFEGLYTGISTLIRENTICVSLDSAVPFLFISSFSFHGFATSTAG